MKKLQAEFRHREFFIQHFGGDVYAVGGFVRDLIREKPTTEVDILIARHSVDDIQKKIEPFGKVDL
ncbi:MAG: hypothetical protein KAU47_08610, partial [Candidatus Aminicenantes bacterium]|nr:hypothetical protein [Candidatus Aminicenantes bacterium]